MNILIAPNAFKNSLTANAAAEAISKGLQQSKLSCSITCFPVGDGGDGTAALLVKHFTGKMINAVVHDPLGRKINTSFGLTDNDKTAVIELADASGLRLLEPAEYDPLHATTYGTGELIKLALDKGVQKIIICIGGSATVDAGTGIMQALGIQFCDAEGKELQSLPASLIKLNGIERTGLDKHLLHAEIIVLCDVDNSLLGQHGSAHFFGPQKGASKDDVHLLENCLMRLCTVIYDETGNNIAAIKHGGAAGGVAAALQHFLHAKLVTGIDYFLDITGFENVLDGADLVITGEGSIDTQTLQGKGPFGVAKRAKQKGKKVIGLAGKVPLVTNEQLNKYFDELLSINNEVMETKLAMQHTYANLERTARMLGDKLSI
ncbi:glycerate kinase [soil metagenome]